MKMQKAPKAETSGKKDSRNLSHFCIYSYINAEM